MNQLSLKMKTKDALIPIILTLLVYIFGIVNQWYYSIPLVVLIGLTRKVKWSWLRYSYNTLLILILFTDLIIRTSFPTLLYYRPFELLNQPHPKFKELYQLKPNQSIYMSVIGDLGAMKGDIEKQVKRITLFETDELGFRNIPGQKDSINKIILLGDSYAMGSGSSDHQTISFQTCNKIYNLGFPGSIHNSCLNYVANIDNINTSEKHNVYFIFFEGNDYQESFSSDFTITPTTSFESFLNRYNSFRRRSAIRQLYTKLLYTDFDPNKKELVAELYGQLHYTPYFDFIHKKDWDSDGFSENIKAFKKFVESKNGELTIIIIPSKEIYNDLEDSKKQQLIAILEECKIHSIDVFLKWKEKELSSSYLWWSDDTHLSPYGNQFIGDLIYNHFLSSKHD